MYYNRNDFLFLIIVIFLFPSCDNTLEPLDKNEGAFSVYGYLDLNHNEHFFRVRDLNSPFTLKATEQIDATVILQNRTLGSSKILPSERHEYKGVFQHNFIFSDSAYANHQYLMTIKRSDGTLIELQTTTPTKPKPVTQPSNQNCDETGEFILSPTNGGTVAVRFGLGPSKNDPWGPEIILYRDPDQNYITYIFNPRDELSRIVPWNSQIDCGAILQNETFYISYTHYAPGFYELLFNEPSESFRTTQLFGALYKDTLAVRVDTRGS